jgi:hypothetical protein
LVDKHSQAFCPLEIVEPVPRKLRKM